MIERTSRGTRPQGSGFARFLGALLAVTSGILIFAPLGWLVLASFREAPSPAETSFSLRWFRALAEDEAMLAATFRSLVVAFGSATLATTLGTAAALGIHLSAWSKRSRRRLRRFLELPWALPDLLLGVLVLVAFAALRKPFAAFAPGLLPLTLGQTVAQLSLVVLVISARLRGIGGEQLEVARDLYADAHFTITRVVLPQLSTAIVGAFLLAFTFSLDDFILGFFLSGPESTPLPVVLHARLKRGASPEIYAVSTLVLLWTAVACAAIATLHRERSSRGGARRGAVVTTLLLLPLGALGFVARGSLATPTERPLSLLLYSEYVDPSLVVEFERETNRKVRLDFYESQEEMIGKLRTFGAGQYDVVVASDSVVPQMRALSLLRPLERKRLPGLDNLGPEFLDPWFDPESKYSVPYLWGTTGVLYRKSDFPEGVPGLVDLLTPGRSERRFTLLDEGRTMLAFALASLHLDPNTSRPNDLARAVEVLRAAKRSPACLGFDGSVASVAKLEHRLASAAFVFSGDAARAVAESGGELAYVLPAEGGLRWMDVLVIPATSRDPALAHRFLDFLLRPENALRLARFVRYETPNRKARFLVGDDPTHPPLAPVDLARLRTLMDNEKSHRLHEEAWALVKAD